MMTISTAHSPFPMLLSFLALGCFVLVAGSSVEAQGTLFVEGNNVGIGTSTPAFPLQVRQNDASLDIVDTNASDAARVLLRLTNNGRINFNLFNAEANENWQFSNTLIGFQINQTTSPGVELRVSNDGDLFLEGQVFASSSRETKESIREVDGLSILNKIRRIPLATWAYRHHRGVRHIGPMAEDFYSIFGLGLGAQTLSPFDTSGVALAAIQGIGNILDKKDKEIARLREQLDQESARVENLNQRLATLETALESLTKNRE